MTSKAPFVRSEKILPYMLESHLKQPRRFDKGNMPWAKHEQTARGQPLWRPGWPRWSRELSPLSDGVAMWSGPSIHASTLSSHRRPLPGTSYQPRAIAIAILLPCTPWTSYARSISLTDRREVEQQSHSHALNQLTYPLHHFVQRWDPLLLWCCWSYQENYLICTTQLLSNSWSFSILDQK